MHPPFLLLLAFGLSVATIRLAASLALRSGVLLDRPSGRKAHGRVVPRAGGVGLFGAWLAVLALGLPTGGLGAALPWLVGAFAFFAIGLLDDLRGSRPRTKLVLQALAALLVVALGLRWEGRSWGPFGALEFGAWTPVMTWLWIVAVVSVVNILDGIDLITCAVTSVVLAGAAGAGVGVSGGALYAAMVGGVLGLALWNVTPARVFAGDAGTHLLGFLVAATALYRPGTDAPSLPWAVASAPLLPAVIDVGWGLVTKRRRGLSFAAAHADHLYQRLTRCGWSHATSALRYGLLACVGLVLVARVAPAWGLGPCLLLAGLALGAHLVDGWRVARLDARRQNGKTIGSRKIATTQSTSARGRPTRR